MYPEFHRTFASFIGYVKVRTRDKAIQKGEKSLYV